MSRNVLSYSWKASEIGRISEQEDEHGNVMFSRKCIQDSVVKSTAVSDVKEQVKSAARLD
jgi:hypothetical protein